MKSFMFVITLDTSDVVSIRFLKAQVMEHSQNRAVVPIVYKIFAEYKLNVLNLQLQNATIVMRKVWLKDCDTFLLRRKLIVDEQQQLQSAVGRPAPQAIGILLTNNLTNQSTLLSLPLSLYQTAEYVVHTMYHYFIRSMRASYQMYEGGEGMILPTVVILSKRPSTDHSPG